MPDQPPQDTISAVNLPDDPGKEPPAVCAVKDLRDHIKPPLDDAIAAPVNAKDSLSTSPCSCNSVCARVPVGRADDRSWMPPYSSVPRGHGKVKTLSR